MRRNNKLFIMIALFLLPSFLYAQQSFVFSPFDVTIFKDSKGRTYAQITSLTLANHLKKELGEIIASTNEGLDDADIINKTIEMLRGAPGSGGQAYTSGKILIKRGVYDLGKKGIKIPTSAGITLSGEGCDLNLPGNWKKIDPRALAGTYLIYSGTDKAFGFSVKSAGTKKIEITNITFVLLEKADYGIHIPTARLFFLDRVAVVAIKPCKWGILADSGAGNPCYLTNIIVKGPVETALDMPIDWGVVINVYLEGFTKIGIIPTGPHIIGGLLR